ncbi:MAG TPA: serine hydrolase domain-containing protein [Candidatus Acidoferrales bacterium]|nr:serine hydrolase domain-containing protein [Candidatus Acidoferrales bacterium]
MTPADIGAFLDGLAPLQLAKYDVAGAVIVVVKDGQILFEKGYGYADVASKRPVSASDTLFRVGSISKLFTWTSVMQLVEQGKINLDRDVSAYLDLPIPATFAQPITMRDLMTHTPGFEEAIDDLFVPRPANLVPLAAYLERHLPSRIYPPGSTPAYSNYGATLAGYIVQRVSGVPFDDYVERNIFQPLGMSHSSFRQPLPAALLPRMSSGYTVASLPAGPYEVVQAWPAGSLATSGEDIARFMIAHLQDGRYGNARILDPQAAQQMPSRQFGLAPSMNGMLLGFYEESSNGQRIFGHGGDTVYFHSDLHLVPAAGLGFFVSYNSMGRDGNTGQARSYLWEKFLDRYFPYAPPAAAPPADAAADAASVAGYYRASRGFETSFMKLATVLGESKVIAGRDGALTVDAFKGLNDKPLRWREIAPMEWRQVDGQRQLVFRRDGSGRWEMVADFPAIVYFRATGLGARGPVQAVIVIVFAVFVLALLLWPVAALVRRHYARPLRLTRPEQRLRLLVKLVCALELAVCLGWVALLSFGGRQPGAFSDQLMPWLRLLQVLGIVGVAASVVAFYNALHSWTQQDRWWWTRIDNLAVAVACLGFLWLVFSMKLLSVARF